MLPSVHIGKYLPPLDLPVVQLFYYFGLLELAESGHSSYSAIRVTSQSFFPVRSCFSISVPTLLHRYCSIIYPSGIIPSAVVQIHLSFRKNRGYLSSSGFHLWTDLPSALPKVFLSYLLDFSSLLSDDSWVISLITYIAKSFPGSKLNRLSVLQRILKLQLI